MLKTLARSRAPALILIVSALLAASCQSEPGLPFDQRAWQQADLTTRTRARMMNDLLERHPLTGLSVAQVTALLGPPTQTDKWQDWDLVYVLGPYGYGVDHEWLVLRIDATDKIVKYRIVKD